MGDQISGMYPTLIIVIVNLQQTIWDAPSSTVSSGPVISTVQWAVVSNRSGPTDTLLKQRGVNVRLGPETARARSGEIHMVEVDVNFDRSVAEDV
jgi:hypothetical protein